MLFYLATIVSLSLFAVTLRLAENVAPFQCSHMGWYTSSAAIVVAIAYYLIAKCLYRCATFILSEKSRSRARLVEIMANMRRRNEAAGLGEGRDGSVEGDGVDDLDAVGPEGAEPIFTIVEEEEEQADGCEMENHIYKTDVEAQHTQTAPSNNVAAGRKRKGGGRRLRKLGALREMFSVGRIYSSVYGLGLGMYFLIYALQMHDSYGNIVFCIALWCVASYEYIDQFIVAPRTELPMTRPLKLLCELLSKDRRNYLILPCILGFYPLVIATHGIHAFFSLGTQDAIDRTDALDVVVNTLFPLLGVMLIKHARPRSNVIETMEVGRPLFQHKHFCAQGVVRLPPRTALPTPPTYQTGGQPHRRNHRRLLLRRLCHDVSRVRAALLLPPDRRRHRRFRGHAGRCTPRLRDSGRLLLRPPDPGYHGLSVRQFQPRVVPDRGSGHVGDVGRARADAKDAYAARGIHVLTRERAHGNRSLSPACGLQNKLASRK